MSAGGHGDGRWNGDGGRCFMSLGERGDDEGVVGDGKRRGNGDGNGDGDGGRCLVSLGERGDEEGGWGCGGGGGGY